MEDKTENLLRRIPKVEQGQRIVLAIDGLSRSGKTTFARNIEHYLNRENRFNRESDETQMNMEKFEKRYWKAEDYYLKHVLQHNMLITLFRMKAYISGITNRALIRKA